MVKTEALRGSPFEEEEKILSEAIIEFGNRGFDLASIQHIVFESGISRGSFYQYFEDKTDLFGEVLMEISARKMKYLEPVLEKKEEYGLFELIKELLMLAMNFGLEDPTAFQIGKDISSSKTLDMKEFMKSMQKEIYKRNHISPESLYQKAIENSIARGGNQLPRAFLPDFWSFNKEKLSSMERHDTGCRINPFLIVSV